MIKKKQSKAKMLMTDFPLCSLALSSFAPASVEWLIPSPGECSRTVEVVKQSRFTYVGVALTHICTGLSQRAQVQPQSTLRWPNRNRFTAKILRRSRRKHTTDPKMLLFQCRRRPGKDNMSSQVHVHTHSAYEKVKKIYLRHFLLVKQCCCYGLVI